MLCHRQEGSKPPHQHTRLLSTKGFRFEHCHPETASSSFHSDTDANMLNNSTWTSRRGGGQSWRGRGKAETPKWGNWYGNKRYNKQAEPDISKLPRGGLLHTVSSSDLVESNPIPNATISGCEYVASYNWLDNPEPTIVVPGRQYLIA
jgi:hypothetical protein